MLRGDKRTKLLAELVQRLASGDTMLVKPGVQARENRIRPVVPAPNTRAILTTFGIDDERPACLRPESTQDGNNAEINRHLAARACRIVEFAEVMRERSCAGFLACAT